MKKTKKDYKKWLAIDARVYMKKKKIKKREKAKNTYRNMSEKETKNLREYKRNRICEVFQKVLQND